MISSLTLYLLYCQINYIVLYILRYYINNKDNVFIIDISVNIYISKHNIKNVTFEKNYTSAIFLDEFSNIITIM